MEGDRVSRELLEAAKAVLKWADECQPFDSVGSEETGCWLSVHGNEVIDALRAAVAKAEGEGIE